jgi:uncharacterized protein (DUF2062 family)
MKTIAAQLLRIYTRLVNIHGEPRPVALGYALGVFLAASPLMGIHCILAVSIAGALRWNKLAAGIGALHSNLFTAPVLYSTTYLIGAKILSIDASLTIPDKPFELLSQGSDIIMALAVGGIILGIPFAIICYYLSLHFLKRYQPNRTFKPNHHENA